MAHIFRLSLALTILLAAATPGFAAELIVDNSDGVVQLKGKWTTTKETQGFYGPDYLFRTPGDGGSSVTWPFPNDAGAGRYEVFGRWSAGPNRATNATYQVASNGGTASVPENQKTSGGAWQSLGSFDFQPNKGHGVKLTDKADGVVVADAIRFLGPQPASLAATALTPTPPTPISVAVPPPAPVPNDARHFAQTGYRIGEDAFWNYFQVRGGVRGSGYPVSNAFLLYGTKLQI